MAQVTSPIILDSTGQQIHSDLQQIKNVLTTPSAAEDITFDNTGTGMQADDVQDAITELKSNLTNLIKTKPLSKSSNTQNFIATGLYNTTSKVLSVYESGDNGLGVPCNIGSLNGQIFVYFFTASGSAYTGAISVDVQYVEI